MFSLDLGSHTRIQKLHEIVSPGLLPSKVEIKKDAWICKGMIVLIKRKVARGNKSRNMAFQKLMDLIQAGVTPILINLSFRFKLVSISSELNFLFEYIYIIYIYIVYIFIYRDDN